MEGAGQPANRPGFLDRAAVPSGGEQITCRLAGAWLFPPAGPASTVRRMTSTLRSKVSAPRRTTAALAAVLPLSLGLAALPVSASAAGDPYWRQVHGGTQASLRGLDAVSGQVAWASGSHGTVLRTTTGGRQWDRVGPAHTGRLQYRDLEAFDADTAVIMSIGNFPGSFRFYRTSDGGRSWQLGYQNREPQAFYDCMGFSDRSHGLALSDPVDGKFRILATDDGGRSWQVQPRAGMPPALPGEFAFAASGTCLVTQGTDAWFATGGGDRARVFRSTDGGRTWTAYDTPVRSGPTAGIYSLAFRDRLHGIAVGGDYTMPETAPRALAVTADGGRTWTLVGGGNAPGDYRSGAAYRPGTGGTAIVVGPTGSDISYDGGFHWHRFDAGSFNAVDCAADGSCWAAGPEGSVARLDRR